MRTLWEPEGLPASAKLSQPVFSDQAYLLTASMCCWASAAGAAAAASKATIVGQFMAWSLSKQPWISLAEGVFGNQVNKRKKRGRRPIFRGPGGDERAQTELRKRAGRTSPGQ
jgi:hypothetical protein